MKLIENILHRFGYAKEKKVVPKRLDEAFPFIKKAATLNKKMLDEENKRIEKYTNQLLYEEIAALIKKHFKDQNETLLKLDEELHAIKKENVKLKLENESLKKLSDVEA